MLTAQLTGGLGNQLFTYARLTNYAHEHNVDLLLDGSITERVLGQRPDLFDFQLMGERQISFRDYSALRIQLERGLWSTSVGRKLFKRYQEPVLGNSNQLPEKPDGWKIRGFFQDFKVAEGFIDLFSRKPLELRSESHVLGKFTEKIEKTKTLAIHIRRGDYLNYKDSFGVLDDNYYLDVYSQALKEITVERVLIFSDSPELVSSFQKKLTVDSEIVGKSQLSTSENLVLMSRCHGIITSNSTFSFWAGILSGHKNVYTPCPWFRSQDEWLSSSNLIRPSWNNCNSIWAD